MSLPRFSFHIGDYHKDTGHLRTVEHGAYLLLMLHYYATGGLPDDDKQLAAIARMTDREWKQHRSVLQSLFKGEAAWQHKRIELELVTAQAKYEKRAKAGSEGGKAKAKGKQTASNATAKPYQPITDNRDINSEANASDAGASDMRTRLFKNGLQTLAEITGKTPDSCRSLVGRWLKSVNDEALHVLAAIEDAARNRVADPVAWINQVLKSHQGTGHGQASKPNGLALALGKLGDHIRENERGAEGREAPPRLLSHG